MRNAVADSPIIDVDDNFYLLIPSRFPPIALFERIANGDHESIAEIESLTNPRLQEKRRLMMARPELDEKTPSLQNWNHAPFAYFNPDGTRFFGPDTPCLELSGDMQTALAVSVAKREKFLSQTKQPGINLDMRGLSRNVQGKFVDGRDWPLDLSHDEFRAMGVEITKRNVDGVLFRSAERPAGIRIGVVNAWTLDTAVQGDHYRYVWDGAQIANLYSFNDGEAIDPKNLVSESAIIAA